MGARRFGFAAAALFAAGCGRDPAPPTPVPEHPRPAAKIRLVAPVAAVAAPSVPTPAAIATPVVEAASASPISASPSPVASPVGTMPASYPPKDECAALPGFPAFRDKLGAAVRKRDAAALVVLADPAVRLDFGGGAGRDELRRRLTTSRPELWRKLEDVLQLGCAADDGLATMPWVFSRMPEDVDPYRAMLVAGDPVIVRVLPSATASPRGELAWALVTPVDGEIDPKARFVEVETSDRSLKGFVAAARLRSLLDYRLVAESQPGGWVITAFLAGD
jgi:hypothetical protein